MPFVRRASNPTDADGGDRARLGSAVAANGLRAMPDSHISQGGADVGSAVGGRAVNRLHRCCGCPPGAAQLVSGTFHSVRPERSAPWSMPLLWRRWSPGYGSGGGPAAWDAAIGAPDGGVPRWARVPRNDPRYRPPARYAELRGGGPPRRTFTTLACRSRRWLHDSGFRPVRACGSTRRKPGGGRRHAPGISCTTRKTGLSGRHCGSSLSGLRPGAAGQQR